MSRGTNYSAKTKSEPKPELETLSLAAAVTAKRLGVSFISCSLQRWRRVGSPAGRRSILILHTLSFSTAVLRQQKLKENGVLPSKLYTSSVHSEDSAALQAFFRMYLNKARKMAVTL